MTAAQRKDLHGALLDAFRTQADFQRVVSFGLDTSLDQLAGHGTLQDQVLALIEWCEAHNRAHDLIAASRRENPGNEKLRLFESAWLAGQQDSAAAAVRTLLPDDSSSAQRLSIRSRLREHGPGTRLASTPEDLMRLLNFGAAWMLYALATLVVVWLVAVDRAPWWAVMLTAVLLLPLTAIFNRGGARRLGPVN